MHQITHRKAFRISSLVGLAALCLSFVLPTGLGDKVKWEGDYEAALARAHSETKVVFLAVNMDAEKGNDRMVKNVYTDRVIRGLSANTVNLVASAARHKSSGACPHLGTITCAEHRAVEVQVNGKILKPDAAGHVVAPQHVWLNGEGQVLLSVPYEVTAGELEWCFHEASRRLNPDYSAKESKASQRPRRWIPDGVYDAEKDEGERPPDLDEAMELIKEIRKGMLKGGDLVRAYKRLAQADVSEARDQISQYMKSGSGGRRGGGKGAANKIKTMVRVLGLASPQSYWEVLDSMVGSGEAMVRNEVAVAIEQLAAPESLKALTKAYKKEKQEVGRKNLLRAIAACGAQDKSARGLLSKAAKQSRDDVLRHNALIGLGWQVSQSDVRAVIEKVMDKGSPEDRFAAVVGMGISRDPLWRETLEELATEPDESALADSISLDQAAKLALEVHSTGEYGILSAALIQASGDTIPRNRLFRPLKGRGKNKKKGK